MTEKRSWFEKPLTALFILTGILIFSFYTFFYSNTFRSGNNSSDYSITLRHYGWDAEEMEKRAAIPLEDALSGIYGIERIVSISENNRVRVYVSFHNAGNGFFSRDDVFYDSVREAAQRVYESLPASAQRPEIRSSGDLRIPFWTAAVYGSNDQGGDSEPDGWLLEKIVKPALGSIEGIAEIEIAGPGIREIIIVPDMEILSSIGLTPGMISGSLAANDSVFSGGTISLYGLEIPIHLDGRYSGRDPESLGEALIPLPYGGYVMLNSIADVLEQERKAEIITRLNGNKTAIISLTAVSGADLRILSNRLKTELAYLSSLPLEFYIMEDRGEEERKAFIAISRAAMEASLLLAAAVILLGVGKNFGIRKAVISAASIPVILIISAAILAYLGFSINRMFLAGLAVGIGSAVDAVILCSYEFSRNKKTRRIDVIKKIWPPLISGAVTTIAALLPLIFLMNDNEITIIAMAIGTVTFVSVVFALSLFPPLLLWETGKNKINKEMQFGLFKNKFRWVFSHFFSFISGLVFKHSVFVAAAALLIALFAFTLLIYSGTDTGGEWADDSVYVQIEFESGFLKEEIDLLLAFWAERIGNHEHIFEVQTGARTGSGNGLVTFNSSKIDTQAIRSYIRSITIPEAFIYIPQMSGNDRVWTISIIGDDIEIIRDLVRQAAFISSFIPEVKESVLNFKEGSPRLNLIPKRDFLAQAGIYFSYISEFLRQGVHGPVAYKRIDETGETDLRIQYMASDGENDSLLYNVLSGRDVLNIPLQSSNGNSLLLVSSMTEAVRTNDVSAIQRENRRRAASFSVRTEPGDPRFYRDIIMPFFDQIDLPSGYRIEFDPDAIAQADNLSKKFFNFFWALLFCYMIIAAIEESFLLPLIILSSVLPSLGIPVIFIFIHGYLFNNAVACALVAVSGIAVNASVISAGFLWSSNGGKFSFYRMIKGKMPVIFAITVTTIAGSIPFLFLADGSNEFIKTLALVTVLGTGVSFICSFTLIPSLINLFIKYKSKSKFDSVLTE